jgi:RNA-directed DNA polymerase
MHFAFDVWMARRFPGCPFERFADDAVVHCATKAEAEEVLDALTGRMEQVGLRLHPDKTRVVYCKDGKRRAEHEHTSFTFLGFTFRARKAQSKDGRRYFSSFLPAMSTQALQAKSDELRAMRIVARTTYNLNDLARWLNPIVGGWMQYYGRFYRSEMHPLLARLNSYLRRWAGKKYRRLRTHKTFQRWWAGLVDRQPRLLVQWKWVRGYWPAA